MATKFPKRFRCPVHGFVLVENQMELDVINHELFQRLRRIRQLAWTDMVYPGATHTRFEHSLGVMHLTSCLFDKLTTRCRPQLEEYGILGGGNDDFGIKRQRQLVRLAALLHDVGHGPYSHASEHLFPKNAEGKPIKHETYSVVAIKEKLSSLFNGHTANEGEITAEMIADFIEGKPGAGRALRWRPLLSGQIDADRMDYLLRDSLHTGVGYGSFDVNQLLDKVTVVAGGEDDAAGPTLGIEEDGIQIAEALVFARYQMYVQVYFHKTRIAYNHHLEEALKFVFRDTTFPPPEELDEYLKWNDFKVYEAICAACDENEHAKRLIERNHYRRVYETSDISRFGMEESELESRKSIEEKRLEAAKIALGDKLVFERSSSHEWYDINQDIIVKRRHGGTFPLSACSNLVASLVGYKKHRLYVRPENKETATTAIEEAIRQTDGGD